MPATLTSRNPANELERLIKLSRTEIMAQVMEFPSTHEKINELILACGAYRDTIRENMHSLPPQKQETYHTADFIRGLLYSKLRTLP